MCQFRFLGPARNSNQRKTIATVRMITQGSSVQRPKLCVRLPASQGKKACFGYLGHPFRNEALEDDIVT